MVRLIEFVLALLELWPLVLPVVVGAAAVFVLLPRPRIMPAGLGAVLAALALVLTGAFLLATDTLTPATFLFYTFSAIAILAGGLLVTQRNPARAALSFALVILSTCGLFLLLAAPFLMAATTVIYAGAIVVTFLFVIMLAQQEGLSDADARSREPLLATITGFLLLGALLYVLKLGQPTADPDLRELVRVVREVREYTDPEQLFAELGHLAGTSPRTEAEKQKEKKEKEEETDPKKPPYREVLPREALRARGLTQLEDQVAPLYASAIAHVNDVGALRGQLDKLEAILEEAQQRLRYPPPPLLRGSAPGPGVPAPLSNLSGTPPTVPPGQVRRDPDSGVPHLPAENSAHLGRSLFTDYLLPVELGGTLLLVATVGAIAIANRRARREGGLR